MFDVTNYFSTKSRAKTTQSDTFFDQWKVIFPSFTFIQAMEIVIMDNYKLVLNDKAICLNISRKKMYICNLSYGSIQKKKSGSVEMYELKAKCFCCFLHTVKEKVIK
jgi:hypothetical protein